MENVYRIKSMITVIRNNPYSKDSLPPERVRVDEYQRTLGMIEEL